MKATTALTGIYSMTGFAQARAERDGGSVRINLRSVNHRFLDLASADAGRVRSIRIAHPAGHSKPACGAATWT